MKTQRPDIFKYHNYQVFLQDWFAYNKASRSAFSLRKLALQAGLASGYLPMVLSGKRPLSGAALAKLLPHLKLNTKEQIFLESLVVIGTSDSHGARMNALNRIRRSQQFQNSNVESAATYEYLTHWFYVAIREMAAFPEFKADALWIQERLAYSVPLKDIQTAIEFLLEKKFIELNGDGSVKSHLKAIDCTGGMYRLVLADFHREILNLAMQSIEKIASTERNVQGHTFALSKKNYDKATDIMNEAISKLRELGQQEKKGDSVYHIEMALIPLTHRKATS